MSQGKDEGYGMTIPLLVDHKGNKLGKSEGNAIWLDPTKTSPFDMYLYFLNITVADIENSFSLERLTPDENSGLFDN